MSAPTADILYHAIDATWPPAAIHDIPGWRLRAGAGGGKRVSAATATAPDPDIAAMEAAQAALGQPPLVMIRPGDEALDARLAAAGYALVDPVTIWCAPVSGIALLPERMTSFIVDWPPLQVQREIWQEGGIGPARIAVMERAQGPKSTVLGRTLDRPAGAAYIAIDGSVAMLHALEVATTFRRRKLARHMMMAAALWAQDAGALWLAVLVTRGNAAANALYASLGMRAVGQYHYRVNTGA